MEFNRLPRSLEEIEYWKASELRTFLIYTGPIVLRGRLKTALYNHFMILSCAIRLLVSSKTCYTYNSVAKKLLIQFVRDYPLYYGAEYVGYNVHGLIHIADFVLVHGCLDNFSAFKYENYLQFIKKSFKNARYPLEDIYNRIIEKINIESHSFALTYPILKHEVNYNPSVNKSFNETYYKEIILEHFVINTSNLKDNFIYTNDHGLVKVIHVIKYLNGKIKMEVIKYNISPMFQNPISSDIIKIFYVHDIIPKPPLISIDVESIKFKCFSFPIDAHKSIAIALMHTT